MIMHEEKLRVTDIVWGKLLIHSVFSPQEGGDGFGYWILILW